LLNFINQQINQLNNQSLCGFAEFYQPSNQSGRQSINLYGALLNFINQPINQSNNQSLWGFAEFYQPTN